MLFYCSWQANRIVFIWCHIFSILYCTNSPLIHSNVLERNKSCSKCKLHLYNKPACHFSVCVVEILTSIGSCLMCIAYLNADECESNRMLCIWIGRRGEEVTLTVNVMPHVKNRTSWMHQMSFMCHWLDMGTALHVDGGKSIKACYSPIYYDSLIKFEPINGLVQLSWH